MERLSLLVSTEIHRFLRANGWEYYLTPYWLRICAPDKVKAFHFLTRFSEALEASAEKISTFVSYGQNIIEIPTMNQPVKSFLQFGQEPRLTIPLLKVVEEILTHPEESMGLVRLSDQAQISVSGGANGLYLLGAKPSHYTKLKRPDYWNLADLEDFNRESKRTLEPNSKSWTEFRYKARYPSPGKDLSLPDDTNMITAYRLIDDGMGNFYHLCKNVAMEPIV